MASLAIEDLHVAELLDHARMARVQGGRIKEPLVEMVPPVEPGGHAGGANIPAIWNNGVDGPIIIWDRS